MPLLHPENIGAEISDGPLCIHCVDSTGDIKKCADIFEGGVQFFLASIPNIDRMLAERLVRKNMKALPYWQENFCDCLNGEEASEAEFKTALNQLKE
ncbi:MAG: hypothetical protein UT36_C0009G0039 [Candidatus Peregrinibacteria bacterium GW2011_GWF2_39_17]|nr:MAG: hypothetical protein UT36_C0009G0039 [Candidatus Peregrinibacteria bacterium GW2011_GWF2_39_17]HCW32717.1 hypothetical protein [Candidatus Peregrinibacteria bacterium]